MSFQTLNIPDFLIKAISSLSYTKPTAIQREAIPIILRGKDLIAEAQTGSGKTAAFALPLIKLLSEGETNELRALILAPTRELAIQVSSAINSYAKYSPKAISVACLIGGEDIDIQLKALAAGANIAVATPGRLLDLTERNKISFSALEILVLDEADKILDLGFKDQLTEILSFLPKKRQNLLFSATMSQKVIRLADSFLREPLSVSIAPDLSAVKQINQRLILVDSDRRRALLQSLIASENWDHTIVFVSSKRAAKNLSRKLSASKIETKSLHGDLRQEERTAVLEEFKNRKFRVLVCTDIAARGIDVENLTHVVNYDLPRSTADYIHRIGRTGRAGKSGHAVSFADQQTLGHFNLIEKRNAIKLTREQIKGFELSESTINPTKGPAPVKGKRKSKKDKLREAAQKSKK